MSTSANISGGKTCYSIKCVNKQFSSKKDIYIIDAGTLPKRSVSTIVRVGENVSEVLRKGKIKL